MTGSEKVSSTLNAVNNQLPLKGFHAPYKDATTGKEFTIEGMGDGRFRIHTRKRQSRKK